MYRRLFSILITIVVISSLILMGIATVSASSITNVAEPRETVAATVSEGTYFSTEVDFITNGPEPWDGNPIISDGDLLGTTGYVYARNHELLELLDVAMDLGLDAADVIDVGDSPGHINSNSLIAFSTELDSPNSGQFTSGDLLTNTGVIIPNVALLHNFGIQSDLGLDAIQFIGDKEDIVSFLVYAATENRAYWVDNPGSLTTTLQEALIDIWFSTEGTAPPPEQPDFLDGDLLSVCDGDIVAGNDQILATDVPAGIPVRGVDFGLDAVTTDRAGSLALIHFSTEILCGNVTSFTNGDVIQYDNGVVYSNYDLVNCFEPKTEFLGLDALSMSVFPEIEIDKQLSGDYDTDTSTGTWVDSLEVLVGTDIYYSFVATNAGNVPVYNVTVTDPTLGNLLHGDPDYVFCTYSTLAAGTSDVCGPFGPVTATEGTFYNTGYAEGCYDIGICAADEDGVHYFGANPSIGLEKTTQDDYGNEGDGIGILHGEDVYWKYYVTNTGNVPLVNLNVTDDQGVAPCFDSEINGDGDDLFEPGEEWLYIATDTAEEGPYMNKGTASGDYEDDVGNSITVTASDMSRYYELDAVGGEIYPVNKVGLIVTWIALPIIVTAGGFYLVRRRVLGSK